jgi:hypothetical protein
MPWATMEISDLVKHTFRAIVSGLALADLVTSHQGVGGDRQPVPWPPLMMQLAAALMADQACPEDDWLTALRSAMAEDQEQFLLIALPVVLVNVDRYGHRQVALRQWGEALGLPNSSIATLVDLFSVLCQVVVSPASSLPCPLPPSARDCHGATPGLAAATAMVNRAQGNYALAIQLAHRQHLGAIPLGLVGVLAGATGGLAGLPLCWRQAIGQPDAAPWRERWPDQTETSLWHLADGLYDRWIGRPASLTQVRETNCDFLPITG